MEILYADRTLAVCIKPAGVLSTDEPGGVPDLLRQELGDENVRTVHRLDRVVGGVMLLARTKRAAAELSQQLRQDHFGKTYLAVVSGVPETPTGTLRHFLHRDKAEKKTYAVAEGTAESQEAILDFEVLETVPGHSLLKIRLRTGRTHQIRCQLSHMGWPIVGDKKYGSGEPMAEGIALWSHSIAFTHTRTGERMSFSHNPPGTWPWTLFSRLSGA